MAQLPMYPGMPNSPVTELAEAVDDTQTTISLVDVSKLQPAPNLAVIGSGENAETVLYESVNGNTLEDVTRGFQGVAQSWQAGQKVARNFTAYDYDAMRTNVEDHETRIADVHDTANSHASRHAAGGPDELTPSQIGAETPAGAQAKASAAEQAAKDWAQTNINTRTVNTLASNSKTNSDPPSSYPMGITIMQTNLSGRGWPQQDGVVTTFKNDANRYGYQTFSYILSPHRQLLRFAAGGDSWSDWTEYWHAGNSGPFYRGTGSPEGGVTAQPGSIYQRTNGEVWVKKTGSGNTGWGQVTVS